MNREFLTSLIDYAGLFPPASLSLQGAAANYARYRQASESWMLAKFVVPIARAAELDPSFPLSVLSSGDFAADARSLEALPNAAAIEIKASHASQIETAMFSLPEQIEKYFEIADLSLIPLIGDYAARAKIRTGGVTADAFPAADFLARFLIACAKSNVAFKATAGLHHALRSQRPLTYAPDSPCGWMYGFLNILAAATLAREGAAEAEVMAALLAETLDRLAPSLDRKRDLAISFGSCSFEEPVGDLKSLGIL